MVNWLLKWKGEKKVSDVGLNRTISTGDSQIITSYQICSQLKLQRRDYHSTGNEFLSSCSLLPWQPTGPDFPEMQHQIKSTKSMLGKCLQSLKCPCNRITVNRPALLGVTHSSPLWSGWGWCEGWGGTHFWSSELGSRGAVDPLMLSWPSGAQLWDPAQLTWLLWNFVSSPVTCGSVVTGTQGHICMQSAQHRARPWTNA